MPNRPATSSIRITLAPETLRERNRRSGSSGSAAIAWRARKNAISASATAPWPSVCAEPQPLPPASTIV